MAQVNPSGRSSCGCMLVVIAIVVGSLAYSGVIKIPSWGGNGNGFTDGGSGSNEQVYSNISFREIKPGSFMMGAPSDEPGYVSAEAQHEVSIASSFALSTHEISELQYWSLMNPSHAVDASLQQKPATNVSWDDAVAFCEKLGQIYSGKRFRLPTESEWEFACRAGEVRMLSVWRDGADWRSDLDEAVNAWKNGDHRRLDRRARSLFNFDSSGSSDVGATAANGWGLGEMHGNVWEWCAAPGINDPDDGPSLQHRPIRGGAWSSITCLDCRSARRGWERRDSRKSSIGFRVLLENP